MAGSQYKLLIEGELSTKNVQAKIDALNKKTRLTLNFVWDKTDLAKLQNQLAELTAKGNTIGKIKLFENDKGGINRAVIEYTNQMGQVEKITRDINTNVKITKERQIDNNKALAEYNKLQKDIARQSAKQADEMAKAAQNADKFLAKAQGMAQTSNVKAAVGKAQEIKVAVTDKDIAKVRELSNQFEILNQKTIGAKSSMASWTDGMKNAMRQTLEYSVSVGLLYGALAQLKDGIQYVTDLNKELTNIQLLQAEGAQTDEQIADL